jgi:hypothetical protein
LGCLEEVVTRVTENSESFETRKMSMSHLIVTTTASGVSPQSHDEERRAYADFASRHAEPEYRAPLAELYAAWRRFNKEFFGGGLQEPHLAFGQTAPRSLGHCEPTTDYGGRLQIAINDGLVIDPNPDWVLNPWPAEGTRRFVEDLLLRFTVRQHVLEVREAEEAGYRGFGPVFTEVANRIGLVLGLPQVVVRRPGHEDEGPPCVGWPHCVRPAGYYGDDITEDVLRLAIGTTGPRPSPAQHMGLLELLLHLLVNQRPGDAQRIIERHLHWLETLRSTRFPVRRRVEHGDEDVDGSPLGEVLLDPAWLKWNGGTVRRMADGIKVYRTFADLPILADALEEAGCQDGRILRHLRERLTHDSRCWVLRLLLALDGE